MQGFEKMVVWSDKQVRNGITSWLWSQVPVRNEKTTVSLSSMFKSCGTSLFARARVTSPQIHLGSGKPTPTRRSGMKFRRGVEGGGGQDDWIRKDHRILRCDPKRRLSEQTQTERKHQHWNDVPPAAACHFPENSSFILRVPPKSMLSLPTTQ